MRLSTKIVAITTTIAIITGLVIGGITMQTTNSSFERYLTDSKKIEIGEWSTIYTSYYEANGDSWDNVQLLITNYSIYQSTPYSSGVGGSNDYHMPIALLDTDGTILAHPTASLVGQRANDTLIERGSPIYSTDDSGEEQLIGYLLPVDYFDHKFWLLEESFTQSARLSIIKGVCFTLVIALLLGLALSINITKPLNRLIVSIRHIGQGSTSEKVIVEGDDEIAELAIAFNQMSSQLAKSEEARVQLFADISHELRTPLTVMSGKLENKLERNEDCTPEEIASLYDEVIRLGGLVSELQNLSRLDAGQMPLSKTLIDFKSFFADFFLLVNADAEARDINLKVDMEDELPYCYADAERLKQIVLNLVSNALRYTTDGGTILIKAWADKKDFCFSVSDTGIGMSEEECAHVFDRFYRTDRSRARETGGTGLGMTITHGLILAHGGSIDVQSKKEVGTTFIVKLPLYDEKSEV